MLPKEKLARINELAKKAKTEHLQQKKQKNNQASSRIFTNISIIHETND